MIQVDATAAKRHAIVRPLLLACLLAFGAGTVLAVVVLWLVAVADQWSRDENTTIFGVVVRRDGTPLFVLGGVPNTFRTLDGKEVPRGEAVAQRDRTWLALPRADSWDPFRTDWQNRLVCVYSGRQGDELWYFLHDGKRDGSCCFVGFDRKTKYRLGYLGVHGFGEEEPSADQRIPADMRTSNLSYVSRSDGKVSLISRNRLMEVDLRKRTVRTLMTADQMLAQGLHSVPVAGPQSDDPADDPPWTACYAVRLPDRVVLLEQKKHTQRSFSLPEDVRGASFYFCELRPDLALLIRTRRIMDDVRCDLDWIDPAGKIVRHEEVEFPTWSIFNKPTKRPWIVAAAVSSPLVNVPLTPLSGTDTEPWPGLVAAYSAGLPNAWAPCALAVLAAVVLAWICYRRQKRYAQPWTAVWVAFILLGGLPAWLAYRWRRRWPVLAACPACSRPAPRDRLHCAHCGAEFPVPQAKGIEVFAG